MKTYKMALAVLIIVMSISPLKTLAMGEQGGEDITLIPDMEKATPSDATPSDARPTMTCLQIPQKLDVVIDPWELDDCGQIYSEEYTIRNAGEKLGILTLEFACKPYEDGDVIVTTDKDGLHDDERKSLYIELVFGDGNKIPLTQDGEKYQAELAPGEELSVLFEGEVNENANSSWQDKDFIIEAVYSWEITGDMIIATDKEPDGDNGDVQDESSSINEEEMLNVDSNREE